MSVAKARTGDPIRPEAVAPARAGFGLISYPWKLPRRHQLGIGVTAAVTILSGGLDAATLALIVPLIDTTTDQLSESGQANDWVESAFGLFDVGITLTGLVIAILILTLVRGVVLIAQIWIGAMYVARYEVDLKRRAYASIMNARWPFFMQQRTGELSNILALETSRAGQAFGALSSSFGAILNVLVYVAIAVAVSWQLTLAVVAATGTVVILLMGLTRLARLLGTGATEANNHLLSEISEGFGLAKTIKSQGMESDMERRFNPIADLRARFDARIGLNAGMFFAVGEIAFILFLLGGLLLGIEVLNQPTSTVALFTILFFRLFQRARMFQQGILRYATYFPGAEAVDRVIQGAEGATESAGGKIFESLEEGVALRHVNYSYVPGTPILDDISLEIPARSMAAFVGPSGVGKTTVLDIVIGLLRSDSGDVFVDGEPLSAYNMSSWRSRIAYVAQDTVLFHDTVAANIGWGKSGATAAEIIAAAKMANADEFISQLPAGYDTVVGDRGARISGGQRQRIALARALIRKPELLILDEATSELDTNSENLIRESLGAIHSETTIMIVAHRYSTIAAADAIYVIEDGRVTETGDMQSLLARKGRFYDLYSGTGVNGQ